MTTTNINIKDFLATLEDVNTKNFAFHVYIPSLQKEVPFLQINTGQQKTLIKSIIDSPVYNTEFIMCLRNIIKDNCLDKTIKVDDLTLLDKMIISLSLRSKSISNVFELSFVYNDAELKHSVDLDILVEAARHIKPQDEKVLEISNYQVTVGAPTISTEYRIEKEIRSKNKTTNERVENNDQLRAVIGEAFVTELVKYVKSVTVAQDEHSLEVNFNTITSKDCVEILSKLPVKILEKILEYANEYNKHIADILKIKIPVGVNQETNEVQYSEQEVQINGNFFIVS